MPPQDPLPPEEEAVRRLLGEARHDEPVPPAVVARIDEVLAVLAAERAAGDEAGGDELAVRREADRRRRRRRGWVAAAAAVAVIGAGGTVLQQAGVEPAGVGPVSGAADRSTASSDGAGDDSAGDTQAEPEGSAGDTGTVHSTSGRRPRLTPRDLTAQVRALLRREPTTGWRQTMAAAACGVDPPVAADVVAVSYAGEDAVLVVHPAGPRGRLVDVVVCGAAGVARSVRVRP